MKPVGIDLGTTNSIVAVIDSGQARVLAREGELDLLPSAVSYDAAGNVSVGATALDMTTVEPANAIVSVKRLMGRTMDEAIELGFDASRLAQEGSALKVEVGGQLRSPVEISAEILKSLRDRASAVMGGNVTRAVITVPAYFDDTQRQATRQAGQLAGLDVMRLLNEPTAAALAYGLDKQSEGCFAVFDLGGGTFDISILNLVDGVFEVLSTGGDTQLGGDDFDRVFAKKLLTEAGYDLETVDAITRRKAIETAEAAKKELTEHYEATVEMMGADGQPFHTRISRDGYRTLIEPILKRAEGPCRRALSDAGLRPEQLDGVVLVGGSTRSPVVKNFVSKLFEQQPLGDIDPDCVVAMGAASQADLLSIESQLRATDGGDVLLLDVTPLSLGLETMGGVVEKVIPRCSQIPASRAQEFTTFKEGQTAMDIHVVQGERELVDDCRSLARFQLAGIPPGPAGQARVRVTFQIDADGILSVSAEDVASGVEQSVTVTPSHGLDDNEIESMLRASFENAEEDVMARVLATARVEAERVLDPLRKALKTDRDLVADDELNVIEQVVADLETAVKGTDHSTIQDLTALLDRVSGGFAQRRMERALQHGLKDVKIDSLEDELKDAPVGGGEHD